jgi:hypothetical protein
MNTAKGVGKTVEREGEQLIKSTQKIFQKEEKQIFTLSSDPKVLEQTNKFDYNPWDTRENAIKIWGRKEKMLNIWKENTEGIHFVGEKPEIKKSRIFLSG